MKKIIYLFIVLVLVSCTDQLTVEEVTEKATVQIPESNVDSLIEQETIRHNDPVLEDAVTGILSILFHGEKGEAYNISNDKSNRSRGIPEVVEGDGICH